MKEKKRAVHFLFGGMAIPAPFISLILAFIKPEIALAFAAFGIACAMISYTAYKTMD